MTSISGIANSFLISHPHVLCFRKQKTTETFQVVGGSKQLSRIVGLFNIFSHPPTAWLGVTAQENKTPHGRKSMRCRNLYRPYFMPHSAVILIKGFDTPPMEHPPAKEY